MGNIIEIDGNKSKKKIVEEMARLLLLKDSNAPRKPPKIIMMGPPGVDLREHASTIARKYKLIYIDSDQLVKDSIRREGESAQDLRQIIKNGEPIPDDHAIRCLRERLEMPDCKTNGWILQGAPTTVDQISMLKELNMQPSLVITLDMSDHLIYEKLEQRRFDPVTNRYHYILSENIRDEAVLNRLIHKYEDQHPHIKKKLLEYRGFMQHVLQEYAASIVRVNAEQPPKDVRKNFIEAIEMTF